GSMGGAINLEFIPLPLLRKAIHHCQDFIMIMEYAESLLACLNILLLETSYDGYSFLYIYPSFLAQHGTRCCLSACLLCILNACFKG
ncbi:hypothetical protein, partial [[Clostridium] innocuum]